MAKRTLLEIVKSCMSDMDSDEITSIADTVEAGQVVSTIRDVYEQILTDTGVPESNSLVQALTVNLLTYAGSISQLQIPDTIEKLYWVSYNIRTVGDVDDNWQELDYLEPTDFLQMVGKNLSSDTSGAIATVDPTSGMTYYIALNVAPRYYTMFDDKYISFDAIDRTIDIPQVTAAKSRCYGKVIRQWPTDPTTYDTFVLQMDENMFPYLIAEVKSTCFVNLKQQANPKIEKQARDQRVRLQNHKFRTRGAEKNYTGSLGPNYGRT